MLIGPYTVDPPVILAPMAGVTGVAFRELCREYALSSMSSACTSVSDTTTVCGLYICEMVTARALLIGSEKTMKMVDFAPAEYPRSLQLYGVDPRTIGEAVRMVVDDNRADHIDVNFGCPVPKVTRRGGGSALPWRHKVFARVIQAAVDAASAAGIPVTVKMRTGIDDKHLTYRSAGLIAQEAGAAAVTLHARTTAQGYSGNADWEAIADLKSRLEIPVVGNGDIWEAEDALRMVAETGVDGVVIGRGCLGRPWIFADLASAFAGRPERRMPMLGDIAQVMRRHAQLLVTWLGDEPRACADFRKHIAWYLKGFPVGGDLRRSLAMVSSLTELDDLLGHLDMNCPFPQRQIGEPRGRTSRSARVVLPEGWLENPDSDEIPYAASSL